MLHIRTTTIVFTKFILLPVLLVLAQPAAVRSEVLTIAAISLDPVEEIRIYNPFADFLAAELEREGITGVKVKIARNIPEIAEMMKNNRADIFFGSSLTALTVNQLTGSKFLLRRWKEGRGKDRSIIFAKADSNIHTLQDLRGKPIAFEQSFSTFGYSLPAVAMRKAGLELLKLDGRVRDWSDKVGYFFAQDSETQVAWLERDWVAAVAISETDYLNFSAKALTPLTLIHLTRYIPYDVVIHREGLDQKYVEAIKTHLLSADSTKSGRATLDGFERTTRFDGVPDELLAAMKDLQPQLLQLDIWQ